MRIFFLALILFSNLAVGAGLTSPTLATNPNGVADFGTNVPFIDLMKQSRPWLTSGATPRDWDYLNANGHLDANGWPSTIPAGSDNIQTVWDWPSEHGNYNANQSYTVEWLGTATIAISGAVTNVVNVDSNTITFDFNSSGGSLGLVITSMSAAPNNPRNITVIRDDLQAAYDAGQRINPDYALFLQDMRQLRFMDWGQTNNSPQVDWADRATPSDVTYSTDRGVPIERQVELCNVVQADCWFNFPHQFTNAAITSMVTYVRDNLDTNLKAFYELSNEVWNAGAFNHQSYFLAQARAEWTNSTGVADFEIALNYYGKRSAEAFQIVDSLYSGILSRRQNVIGSLNDDNDFTHQAAMQATTWQTEDPGNYVQPASLAQALAIAPYYGVDMLTGNTATIQAEFTAGTHIDWIYDYLTNPVNDDSVPSMNTNISVADTAASGEGLDLIMYEGLRHYLHGGIASGDVLTALQEFSRHSRDADLVLQVWETWENYGEGPLMVFSDIGGHSAFGAWTLSEYYGDTSAYSEMLSALNNSTADWWGDSRDFSNPVIANATDYSIHPGIGRPIREARVYHYLNSLTDHAIGGEGGDNDTNVLNWAARIANHSGQTYQADGQFGFADSWTIPPLSTLGWADVTTPNTGSSWGTANAANITHVYFTPDNFNMGTQGPTVGVFNGGTYPVQIGALMDGWNANTTDPDYVIYEGWPDGGGFFVEPEVATAQAWIDYKAYALDENPRTVGNTGYQWYLDEVLSTLQTDRPGDTIGRVQVSKILLSLVDESYLSSTVPIDYYVDSAPHGNETWYFLAGMVYYVELFKQRVPATYIPEPSVGVASFVTNNLQQIKDFIFNQYSSVPPVVTPPQSNPVRPAFGGGSISFGGQGIKLN